MKTNQQRAKLDMRNWKWGVDVNMDRSRCEEILFELIAHIPQTVPAAPPAPAAPAGLDDNQIHITISSENVEKLRSFNVTPEQIEQAHGIWLNDYIQAFVEDPTNSDLSQEIIDKLADAGITKISDIVNLSKENNVDNWNSFTLQEKMSLANIWNSSFEEDPDLEKITNTEFLDFIT
jgi:hypothetical protein